MNISKKTIGKLTLLPFLAVPVIILLAIMSGGMGMHVEFILALTVVSVIVLSLFLFVYYIVHAINNENLDGTEKALWIVLFFTAGSVGMPIYYFMRIKDDNTPRMNKNQSDFVDPIIT